MLLTDCNLCNRHCHVNRSAGISGYCGMTDEIYAARAALHFWEEPCISGTKGSGAVFFSGCSLRCVFCQNHNIALGQQGTPLTISRLADIFLMLQNEQHAHNINLVTPTHYIPQIVSALELAKKSGLKVPIVYNTGSYETVEALKYLDGLVDIYLPDLKYYSSDLSQDCSNAANYFTCASAAIAEMYRQVGKPVFTVNPDHLPAASELDLSEQGLMTRGMIVRHLLLPGCADDSKKVLEYLYQTYGDSIFISIMNQYTPMTQVSQSNISTILGSAASFATGSASEASSGNVPQLFRKVTSAEYDAVVDYAISLGIENAFIQDGDTAQESFIPDFNGEGLL